MCILFENISHTTLTFKEVAILKIKGFFQVLITFLGLAISNPFCQTCGTCHFVLLQDWQAQIFTPKTHKFWTNKQHEHDLNLKSKKYLHDLGDWSNHDGEQSRKLRNSTYKVKGLETYNWNGRRNVFWKQRLNNHKWHQPYMKSTTT